MKSFDISLSVLRILVLFLILMILIAIFLSGYFYGFNIIEFFLFNIFVIFFVIVPGYMILSLLPPLNITNKEKFVIGNAIGFAAIAYFSWLFSSIFMLPRMTLVYCLIVLYLFYIYRLRPRTSIVWIKTSFLRFINPAIPDQFKLKEVIILLAWVLFSFILSSSVQINATLKDGYYPFYSSTGVDGLWLMGHIAYLKKSYLFEDIHQNGAPYAYHFFSYIFCSYPSALFNIEISDILFKFLPLYQFFFFTYSAYLVFQKWTGRRIIGIIGVFILVFLDTVKIPLIYLKQILNADWLDYLNIALRNTPTLVLSPSYLSGFVLFTPSLLLVRRLGGEFRWLSPLIVGFIYGTLIGFKSHTYTVVAMGLICMSFIEYFQHRKFNFLTIGITALVTSFPFLWQLTNYDSSKLIFNPGLWIVDSKLANWMSQNLNIYAPFSLLIILLPLYILCELGPRLVAFRLFKFHFKGMDVSIKFLWCLSLTGIVFALLFTPETQKFNVAYFSRFSEFCFSILAIFVLTSYFIQQKKFVTVCLSFFFAIYMLGGFYTFFRKPSEATLKVPSDKIEGLKKLRSEGNTFSRIMSNRFQYGIEWERDKELFSLYTAYGEQIALSEGKGQKDVIPTDINQFNEIRKDISIFYSTSSSDTALQIINKWRVDYVIVDLEYLQTLHFKTDFLEKIHESKNLIIFSTKKVTTSG